MFRASLALLLVVIASLHLSCAEMQSSGVTNALTKLVTGENPLFILRGPQDELSGHCTC